LIIDDHQTVYFKNPKMLELDSKYGELENSIIDAESAILR
jgi:hypothetical protein